MERNNEILYIFFIIAAVYVAVIYSKMILIWRDVMLEQNKKRLSDSKKLYAAYKKSNPKPLISNPTINQMIKQLKNGSN